MVHCFGIRRHVRSYKVSTFYAMSNNVVLQWEKGWKVRRKKPRTPRIFGICPQTINRWTNIIINRGWFDPVVQLQQECRSWNRSYFQARGLERGQSWHEMRSNFGHQSDHPKWSSKLTMIMKVTIYTAGQASTDRWCNYSSPAPETKVILVQKAGFPGWLIIIVWMVSIGRGSLGDSRV